MFVVNEPGEGGSPGGLTIVELGSRDSNPDFLGNNQARYLYNTPQISRDGRIRTDALLVPNQADYAKLSHIPISRAPSGTRTRTPCMASR